MINPEKSEGFPCRWNYYFYTSYRERRGVPRAERKMRVATSSRGRRNLRLVQRRPVGRLFEDRTLTELRSFWRMTSQG